MSNTPNFAKGSPTVRRLAKELADLLTPEQLVALVGSLTAAPSPSVDAGAEKPAPYPVGLYPGCPCYKCDSATWAPVGSGFSTLCRTRMSLCPKCGNKRCPGAADHTNPCSGSNEPGQPGSLYE